MGKYFRTDCFRGDAKDTLNVNVARKNHTKLCEF